MLSSSARVSQVTYQTVVGVRYPELVTFNGTSWNFGKYVPHERPQRGGFLPIFWDVPRANTHAVQDIGAVVDWLTERCEFHADAKSNLAVLHNRNDMTNLFRASNWGMVGQLSKYAKAKRVKLELLARVFSLAGKQEQKQKQTKNNKNTNTQNSR